MTLEHELGRQFEKELEKKENQPVLLEKISVYTRFMYIVASLLFLSLSLYTIVPTINVFKNKKYRTIFTVHI